MNCKQINDVLEQFLRGELSGAEARSVRTHLASCPACACGLTSAERMELLPALDEEIEPSDGFAARFRAKLEERRQPDGGSQAVHSWRARIGRWGLPRRLAAAGALAALIAAGVFWGLHPNGTLNPSVTDSDLLIADRLPLLEDMAVIKNLDFLEDFDTIEKLPSHLNGLESQRRNP